MTEQKYTQLRVFFFPLRHTMNIKPRLRFPSRLLSNDSLLHPLNLSHYFWSHFILRRKCQPKNKQSPWKGSRWKQKSMYTLIQSEKHFLYLLSDLRCFSSFLPHHRGVLETQRNVRTHWNKIHFPRLLIPGGNHLLGPFRSSRVYWKWMWFIYFI